MNIGVVYPDSGWILSTIARRMVEAYAPGAPQSMRLWTWEQVKQAPASELATVDAWYYVDIQNCWAPVMRTVFPDAVHVGMFTHLDQDSPASFRRGWDLLDGVVHMARRYRDTFEEQGWYPAERMTVLRPGEIDGRFPIKPVRIGVVQRGEHVGKGKDFLPAVLGQLTDEERGLLRLHFCGRGWLAEGDRRDPTSGHDYHGVQAHDWNEIDFCDVYGAIDYLLIPSLWEGGPMALLEALATGTPVIAAGVGWVTDLLFEPMGTTSRRPWDLSPVVAVDGGAAWVYPSGDVQSCAQILHHLIDQRVRLRRRVAGMSYARYAHDVVDFISRIKHIKGGGQ